MCCACLLLEGSLVVYTHILTFRKPSPILMCVGGFCWSVLGNSVGVHVCGGVVVVVGGWVCIGVCVCVCVCVRVHAHVRIVCMLVLHMSKCRCSDVM